MILKEISKEGYLDMLKGQLSAEINHLNVEERKEMYNAFVAMIFELILDDDKFSYREKVREIARIA